MAPTVACLTPVLGGYAALCTDWGSARRANTSRRERHCPKCAAHMGVDRLDARQAEWLRAC
ncbi:MAG: hypothetical protein HIU90_03365 [Proteobacteria bacterium]|nr:hypothetical protein [Pseudomonadota bacterium]